MANVSWGAIGKTGHFATVTVPARSQVTLDLQNSSYNNKKVYQTSMLVQNAGNDGSVIVLDYQNQPRTIPVNTNQKIAVDTMPQCTVQNNGRVPCVLLLLDKAGETESDVNLTPSTSQTGVSINDFLYHFEEATTPTFINSGSEKMFAMTNTADFAPTTTDVKFGVRGVAKAGAAGAQNIEWTDNGFFEMAKNFTVDFWYNYAGPNVAGAPIFYFRSAPASAPDNLNIVNAASPSPIGLMVGGSPFQSAGNVITAGAGYQFIQIVKEEDNYRVYVDGVIVINVIRPSNFTRNVMGIGSPLATGTPPGAYDEFRYSKGFVQTDNSVPTAPYY